mmetsp:Transcript_33283/g.99058  ORF Transcript_33283/g.99058 Transcript_33283/m.99058 type:complete len:599 (-) Transcript_33283:1276-3072(-)
MYDWPVTTARVARGRGLVWGILICIAGAFLLQLRNLIKLSASLQESLSLELDLASALDQLFAAPGGGGESTLSRSHPPTISTNATKISVAASGGGMLHGRQQRGEWVSAPGVTQYKRVVSYCAFSVGGNDLCRLFEPSPRNASFNEERELDYHHARHHLPGWNPSKENDLVGFHVPRADAGLSSPYDSVSPDNDEQDESESECVQTEPWQSSPRKTCNAFHELDFLEELRGKRVNKKGNGWWTLGWELKVVQGVPLPRTVNQTSSESTSGAGDGPRSIMLKALRLKFQNFTDASTLRAFREGSVLSRLAGSKHVVQLYGFCSHSFLMEMAAGEMREHIEKHFRDISSAQKLDMAAQVAEGVAEVHDVDGADRPTVVHKDLKPANVLRMSDGTLKLSDFNNAQLVLRNRTSGGVCEMRRRDVRRNSVSTGLLLLLYSVPASQHFLAQPYFSGSMCVPHVPCVASFASCLGYCFNLFPPPPRTKFYSPEEARNAPFTQKVDVYALGTVLFFILVGIEPYEVEHGRYGTRHARKADNSIRKCEPPKLPELYRSSLDPGTVAMRDAMRRCHACDPSERPTAGEIAADLRKALTELSEDRARH